MKTDFSAIKEELQKLTDVEYLKKELSRAAKEIKNFDVDKLNLSPEAKAKLKTLEARFNELVDRLRVLEKQVDTEVHKFMVILKKTKADAEARFHAFTNGAGGKKSKKKAGKKKASRKKAN
jgi:hypothetical protein